MQTTPPGPERPTSAPDSTANSPRLLRHMGLTALVVYGVGDMVGAGIYGTIGKAAGQLGNAVWMSFVVSMVAAMLTGLSYACLASRYPRAAGAAYVTHRAFHFSFLSYFIGLTVTASGLTSMATSTNVFADNLVHLLGGSWWLMVLLFLGFMTLVNLRGIRQSMWTNYLCTAVEVGGLVFIIIVGMRYWGSVNYLETPRATFDSAGTMLSTGFAPSMMLAGAVLTFFSFVGFEDMLNVAEEVKEPRTTMPWGIMLALIITTLLYIAVAITTVSVVSYQDLATASAPLSLITDKATPWLPVWTFDLITLFAVANTVLINYVMGSRMLYGMARQGLLPSVLGRVHGRWRTPHIAILTLLVLVLVLAASGRVRELATATGLLLLFSFMVVNGALVRLKTRPTEPRGAFEVPVVVPILGIVISALLIGSRIWAEVTGPARTDGGLSAPVIAGGVVLGVGVLYLIMRPKALTEDQLAAIEHDAGA